MHKLTVLLVTVAIFIQASECGVTYSYGSSGSSQGGRTGYVGRRNSYIGSQSVITTTTSAPTPREILDRKGLSMFGLISLMVLVIVLALALYYGVMCYPFICGTPKAEKHYSNYDAMTASTSRSIQSSIENFSCDQKV